MPRCMGSRACLEAENRQRGRDAQAQTVQGSDTCDTALRFYVPDDHVQHSFPASHVRPRPRAPLRLNERRWPGPARPPTRWVLAAPWLLPGWSPPSRLAHPSLYSACSRSRNWSHRLPITCSSSSHRRAQGTWRRKVHKRQPGLPAGVGASPKRAGASGWRGCTGDRAAAVPPCWRRCRHGCKAPPCRR